MKSQECGEVMTVERYILGELSATERDRFEEHYFACPDCAEAVRELSQLSDGVREGLCAVPRPSSVPRVGWLMMFRQWVQVPRLATAMAALALASVTGYQYAQMRSQLHPQVLQSIALQPATRGELPRVALSAGPFVLLEADLPGAAGNVSWKLEQSNGAPVTQGTAAAPEPGLSFKILVPAASLNASQYTLQVRSDAGREWQFRFQTGGR